MIGFDKIYPEPSWWQYLIEGPLKILRLLFRLRKEEKGEHKPTQLEYSMIENNNKMVMFGIPILLLILCSYLYFVPDAKHKWRVK
jgi:hypothetical protein